MLLLITLLSSTAFADTVKDSLVEYIQVSATSAGVDPATALAIVEQESSFNPKVKPRWEPKYKTYSVGLFQMFYPTAIDMGFRGTIKQLQNPIVNIKLGIGHLKACTTRFGNSPKLVACCHNAGVAVKVSFCKNYAWTATYVKEVLQKKAHWDLFLAPKMACSI